MAARHPSNHFRDESLTNSTVTRRFVNPTVGCVLAAAMLLAASAVSAQPDGTASAQQGTKADATAETDRPEKSPEKPRSVRDGSRPLMVTREREAAAMAFVRTHHAELGDVLAVLAESNPKEYEKEIRKIFQTSETLANLQEHDPELYAMDLSAWVLDSKVRLAAARFGMVQSESAVDELRGLLTERTELRINRRILLRDRAQVRLAEMNRGIEAAERGKEKEISRQLERLTKGAKP
jgi:hypothetical protein